MSQDDSRVLTRKSTRGIRVIHLVASLGLRDERLTWCVRGSVQANPKESRERCAELWESTRGTGRAEGY